ncbi:MAG: alpha/beta hydrolase-fold protein [Planctomycetota bacterium]
MRNQPLLLVASAFLLAVPALAQNPPGGGDRPRRERREAPPVELKNLTFKTEKLKSEAIGQETDFGIYLPKDYDADANKDRKWPLAIWLHGMFEDHMRFHTRGGAEVLDRCVGDGKLPGCLFVTANGGRTSMYVNRKDQRWEDLITVDLLAHLTKNWRVSEQREQRAIMGVSMGGMAALRIAFTKPELFGAVGAHSSAVFEEDPEQLPKRMKDMASRMGLDEVFGNPIQKEPWQKANPLCIANAADPKVLGTLRIYFDAGTEDRYGFAAGNKLLHAALDQHKVAHTWRLIEGGGHSWGAGFQDQTLPYSFAVVGEMFAGKKAGSAGGKDAGGDQGDKKADPGNGK